MRPLWICVAGALIGCNQDIKTPFPEGLEPLEENKASWPSGGGYPETLSCTSGFDEDADVGEYTWVHCKTYVNHSISEVYEALQRPRVTADRRAVDELTVTPDVEPEYEVSYQVHNIVYDVITVEFDNNWRHGDVDGYKDELSAVGTRWQKTFGSEVIELRRGSIYTSQIDDSHTGMEIVVHQKTLQEDEPLIMNYLRDLQADILAATDGDDLPEYPSGA